MEASSPPPTPASGGQSGTNVMLKNFNVSPERVKEVAAQSFSNTIGIQYSIFGGINKILFSSTPSGLVLFVFLRPGASPLAMYFLPFWHRLCLRVFIN